MLPNEFKLFQMVDLPPGSRVLNLGEKPIAGYVEPLQVMGCEVVQLDLNGLNGALPLDLCAELTAADIGGAVDLVTNFGTTEHVEDQAACWANVDRFLKVGGTLLSTTPLAGEMPHHGRWYPLPRWFYEWGVLNGYRLRHASVMGNPGMLYVNVLLVKTKQVETMQMPKECFMWENESGRAAGAYGRKRVIVIDPNTGEVLRVKEAEQVNG
jgi:hypothetical protein